jgi:hypothetical protein
MKLEAGKTYITRGGDKVRILCTDAKRTDPVVGLMEIEGREGLASFQLDGSWGEVFASRGDIVGPWVEKPVFDRSLLPPWCNKAIAMDENGEWYAFDVVPLVLDDAWTGQDYAVYIPDAYAPKWEGDWKHSLLVWGDDK